MHLSGPIQHTVLYETHRVLNAKMVAFGGWEMPVQYSSIIEEHRAVRESAGVFDISHMGEFFVSGPGAGEWLNEVLTNDTQKLKIAEGQYTLLLNKEGGVIDDLIVYRLEKEKYFLVVNASKIEEDFAWLNQRMGPKMSITLENRSDQMSGLALQGPQAIKVFQGVFGVQETVPSRFQIKVFLWNGVDVFVCRTGYTGEDGVELFLPNSMTIELWKLLLEHGAKPCGLGARDSLRLEACYPLNGNDLGPDTTPLEAGLGFAVALDKAKFIGREVLITQKTQGLNRKLVAFSVQGKGAPPRSHYPLFCKGRKVGEVTSGGFSPTLQKGIGMGYVEASCAKQGEILEMEVRGQRVPIVIEKKPFYKSKSL